MFRAATCCNLESSEVVVRGRQSGSRTATSYEGLPRDDFVAKIKHDTLDKISGSIHTAQRPYWIVCKKTQSNAIAIPTVTRMENTTLMEMTQRSAMHNGTVPCDGRENDHEKKRPWEQRNGLQCTAALSRGVRLDANIPWSPPASTRNVDCWPPHHYEEH